MRVSEIQSPQGFAAGTSTATVILTSSHLGFPLSTTQVAKTISSGLVDDAKITPTVIFAGLVGAIVWNLLTWLVGLPSSSSHALIGGLIGATWVAAGADAVKFASLVGKVLLPAILAPLIAGLIALIAIGRASCRERVYGTA